jgi:ABC-type transport system substrate-binding protein
MTRRYSRRQALRLAAGAAAAGLLVGCGEEPAPPSAPTPEPTRRIRLRSRAVPPDPPPPAGSLRLSVIRAEPDHGELDRTEAMLAYSRLVSVDPRTAMVYADLASAIEIPEPLDVRVELRRGLRFHPGEGDVADPLDAEAVVRDLERRRADSAFLLTNVLDGLDARGSNLTLRLRAPFSLLFDFLSLPDYSIRGDRRYGRVPARVGSGAFVPLGRAGADQVFTANPALTGSSAPRLAEVVVRGAATDRELDAAFARGEAHVRVHPDVVSRQAAAERGDRVEVARPSRRMRGLALSLLRSTEPGAPERSAHFQDARVRRAISMALDRGAIYGLDGSLPSGPVGPAHAGDALPPAELEAHPVLRHNPAGAVMQIAAAGAEGLTFRLMHASTASMTALGQLVAEQLARAGITVRLQSLPAEDFEAAFLRGAFEAALFELRGLDTPDIGLRLHTSGGLDGRASPWGYSNPLYDAAVRECLSQIDPEVRARRAREAQRRLLEDVPAMFPLGCPVEYASLAPGVEGFEFAAYEHNAGYLAPAWTMRSEGGA